jgi:hypothetical protein
MQYLQPLTNMVLTLLFQTGKYAIFEDEDYLQIAI